MRGTVRVRIGDCECCRGFKHKQTYERTIRNYRQLPSPQLMETAAHDQLLPIVALGRVSLPWGDWDVGYVRDVGWFTLRWSYDFPG